MSDVGITLPSLGRLVKFGGARGDKVSKRRSLWRKGLADASVGAAVAGRGAPVLGGASLTHIRSVRRAGVACRTARRPGIARVRRLETPGRRLEALVVPLPNVEGVG